MGFVPFMVEHNCLIWKGMKGFGFVISLSKLSAVMATFKSFCKLAYVKKKLYLDIFFFQNLLMLKKIHVHQVGLIHILHPYYTN